MEHRELIIFIGHSQDARAEAEFVYSLESDFQRLLRQVDGPKPCLSSLRCFIWHQDATITIGGQEASINPTLSNARIGVFVFKERIGETTWEELMYCQQHCIPVLAIFPKCSPSADKMADLKVAKNWYELMVKKESLTANWNRPTSDSITPVDSYESNDDLQRIVTKGITSLISNIVHKEKTILHRPKNRRPNYFKILGLIILKRKA